MDQGIRKTWDFKYPAVDLFEAAYKKKQISEEKLKFWEKKKAEIEKEIRESGITITPASLAEQLGKNSLSNSYGGSRPANTVSIDETMEKNWNEAQERITRYKTALIEYSNWVAILEDETGTHSLRYDDWLYFFGE